MAITPEQVQIVKATVPVLQAHGNDITTIFYKNMLAENPQLNSIFNAANQAHQHQPRALAGALYAYASNMDSLGNLAPALELICRKHASLYVRPEQYQIVGTYLLQAMGLVLKDAFTDAVRDAWAAAYWQLANLMIDREAQLYHDWDGWTDWRDFRIVRKVVEADDITSFHLAPVDGRPLAAFAPGQYISIQLHVPALNHRQTRQYSLSDAAAPDHYRISVKRHRGFNASTMPGQVSNLLHDHFDEGDVVQLSHPSGDFFLDGENAQAAAPVVLISAGVGVTPLMSMLNTLTGTAGESSRPIHWIHGTRGEGAAAPFLQHVRAKAERHKNVKATVFSKTPAADDKPGHHYDAVGRVDLSKLDPQSDLFLNDGRTRYYICGPTSFMTDVEKALKAHGVDGARIKYELFGTGGVA